MQLPWLCSSDERDALRREFAGVGPERMLREMGEVLDRVPIPVAGREVHLGEATLTTKQLIDQAHALDELGPIEP